MVRCAASALLAITTAACAASEPTTSHELAEAAFLAPYAGARASTCEDRGFTLTLADRPNTIIETLPPIEESAWQLTTCRDDLRFTLDCSPQDDGFRCGAHDWPRPIGPFAGGELAHEIEAAIRVAPPCSRGTSCLAKQSLRCSQDGVRIRRYEPKIEMETSFDYATGFYEVERCEKTRDVTVRCTRDEPFRCLTSYRDVSP